jgi:putative ABC transport system permease protein
MALRVNLLPIFEGVGIAIESLRVNKVRAFLTIMGVAIGVFVVVAMTSVIRGVNESLARDLEAAGPTSFFVYRRPLRTVSSCDPEDQDCRQLRYPAVTLQEAQRIRDLPIIEEVTAHAASSATVRNADRSLRAGVEIYTPGWTKIDGGEIDPGRSFTAAENDGAARVVILNAKLAKALFDDRDPIDSTVQVNTVSMRVIGVYHYMASPMGTPTSAGGGDSPKAIVPFETARRNLNFFAGSMDLIVKPRSGVGVEVATDEVTAQMRIARKLRPAEEDNFAIVTQDRLLEIFADLTRTFVLVMLALSSVGLLVGGIGVVAIMMISVTERTKEIGVRKALGATRAVILWQFLVEAVTLTAIGASVGLIMGIGPSMLSRTLFPIPTSTPLTAVIAALAMSAFTGIVFGILPAARAANLDPIDALRYE